MEARRCLGVLMYLRKAVLCHLPRVWIMESSTPTMAAVVAAPMRKLCPAYSEAGMPTDCSNSLKRLMKTGFDNGLPDASR